MGWSIARGVTALEADLDGAFIVPGDMPFLTPAVLKALMAAFEETGARLAVHPTLADGAQRAPVLWPRHLLSRLLSLVGFPPAARVSLRNFANETHAVTITDAALLTDVDTAEELAAARAHLVRFAERFLILGTLNGVRRH